MRWLLVVLGVVVLVTTVVDLFATVAWPGRRGATLATRLSDVQWRAALRLHRAVPSHRRLGAAGVACVVLVPLSWMAAMWAGWSLVFLGAERAVLDSGTREPADAASRLYYAGYSLFTSGLGDKVPGGAPWQLATVVATAMGLGLVTLAITYLVPVVQAATSRRALARQITHLGGSPSGILQRCWRPPEVTHLEQVAPDLLARIEQLTEQHLTYPVLHHLHSTDADTAFLPRVAGLHDAVVVALDGCVDGDDRVWFGLLVDAIDDLSEAFSLGDEDGIATPPVPPGLAEDDAAVAALRRCTGRRRRLHALVRRDGWDWAAVAGSPVRPGS